MLQISILLIMFGSYTQGKMIKHTGQNYEILYPAGWIKQEKSNVLIFMSPRENERDLFQENVNLILQDLSQQPMSLEEYTELTKKQVTDNIGAKAIVSLKATTLAGQQAMEFVYNMYYQGRNLKVKQYWFIKSNIAYVFTFTAEQSQYGGYESTALEMIKSFKFTK